MSLPASIPTAIIETLLLPLIPLLLSGANGDQAAARDAALRLLANLRPRDEQETSLAASIVGFDLHAADALRRSGEPDLPVTRVLRLRSSAASLSREAHRYRKELKLLQKQPLDTADAPQEQDAPPRVTSEDAVQLMEEAQKIVAAAAKDAKQGRYNGMTYSQALRKRMTTQRLLAKQKSRAAEAARLGSLSGQGIAEAIPA